jgi:hypothetical protein
MRNTPSRRQLLGGILAGLAGWLLGRAGTRGAQPQRATEPTAPAPAPQVQVYAYPVHPGVGSCTIARYDADGRLLSRQDVGPARLGGLR